jgi:four helix bundle protein
MIDHTQTTEVNFNSSQRKTVQSYKDLEIYLLSHRLAVRVHEMTISLPNFEMYEEGSQIRRSAKAISANIVEGFGRRRYKKEFIRFMVYAHSSSLETIEHLSILFETHSIGKGIYEELKELCEKLSKMIYKFILAVEKGHKDG